MQSKVVSIIKNDLKTIELASIMSQLFCLKQKKCKNKKQHVNRDQSRFPVKETATSKNQGIWTETHVYRSANRQ